MRVARRTLGTILALCAAVALATWLLARPAPERPPGRGTPDRIVSLTPAITETLFTIGAGPRLAGVSDYCRHPAEVTRLPRLGTALTPNFEAIARLQPDLIVSDQSVASDKTRLDALGPTLRLKWLSLADIVGSVKELGRHTGTGARADALARRLEERFSAPPKAGAPRVLLVLSAESNGVDPVWFIRRNSIHGAALRAAGGRNVVDEDIHAMPRISLERVIALQPDVIVLLVGDSDGAAALAAWRKVSVLRAVQQGRVGVLRGDGAFADGPRILDFADQLEREIERLAVGR